MRYGWFAKSFDARKASIRLRLLAPVALLRGRGFDIETWRPAHADAYDVLLFSKSFTRAGIALGRAAEKAGKPIIVDICDNVFDQPEHRERSRERIVEQLRRASLVTIPTPELGSQLAAHLPEIAPRLRLVPDMLEDLSASSPGATGWLDRRRLERLRRFLAAHSDALHCVWFGSSRGKAAGLVHLGRALEALDRFQPLHPVTMTVIGDEPSAASNVLRRSCVPSHYLPWSLATFGTALRLHRLALIPVQNNSFTQGKTINRPATAILAGLGVIADPLASYEELRPFIALDDWQAGLARYAFSWQAERDRIQAAQHHLLDRYGPDAVVARWEAVLTEITGPN